MPRKIFVAGEILTAADVNTNLMDQAVMVFDDATDRATAIPTPVEGMLTYLEDVGGAQGLEVFDGSVFTPVAIVPEPAGLVAVKSAIRDTPEVFSNVAAGANEPVGGLEIVHEVADPANRLIISAFFGVAASTGGRGAVGLAVDDGTGFIAVGASPGNRSAVTAGGRIANVSSDNLTQALAATFVHIPGSGSKTYTVRILNVEAGEQTLFVNRGQNSGDAVNRVRGASSITIQEVTV